MAEARTDPSRRKAKSAGLNGDLGSSHPGWPHWPQWPQWRASPSPRLRASTSRVAHSLAGRSSPRARVLDRQDRSSARRPRSAPSAPRASRPSPTAKRRFWGRVRRTHRRPLLPPSLCCPHRLLPASLCCPHLNPKARELQAFIPRGRLARALARALAHALSCRRPRTLLGMNHPLRRAARRHSR